MLHPGQSSVNELCVERNGKQLMLTLTHPKLLHIIHIQQVQSYISATINKNSTKCFSLLLYKILSLPLSLSINTHIQYIPRRANAQTVHIRHTRLPWRHLSSTVYHHKSSGHFLQLNEGEAQLPSFPEHISFGWPMLPCCTDVTSIQPKAMTEPCLRWVEDSNFSVVSCLTHLEWNIILRKAENHEEWRKLVVKSTVMLQQSARLRDR